MDLVERLAATEEIKRLKATYWYAVDTKDWPLLESLFTDDVTIDVREDRAIAAGVEPDVRPLEDALAAGVEGVLKGLDVYMLAMKQVVGQWTTVHQGHAPVITIDDDTSAHGIWPLFDIISDGERTLRGYGHYHERYRKVGDRWLIASFRITRLLVEGDYPRGDLPKSA